MIPPDDRLRRRVLWAMPTGIYVIGSASAEEMNLMTASLVVQVATQPKLVAVAIDVRARTHPLVAGGGCFSVNVMSREHRAVVRRFAKPALEPLGATEIGGQAVTVAVTGAPVLGSALGWLDCSVRHRLALGSHELFVGEVVAVGGPEEDIGPVLRMEDTRMSYGG